MQNIRTTFDGDTLILAIKIDPETVKNAPNSKSGKTRIIASSGGFITLTGDDGRAVMLNLTLATR